eukprot:4745517-Alexandrium_andersonii.AAC.1
MAWYAAAPSSRTARMTTGNAPGNATATSLTVRTAMLSRGRSSCPSFAAAAPREQCRCPATPRAAAGGR